MKLEQIKDVKDAIKFLESKRREGAKENTIYTYKYLLEKKLKEKIPLKVRRAFTEVDTPSEEEVKAVMEAMKKKKSKYYLLLKFIILTGCRISEALNIRFRDVVIEKDLVRIRVVGKGRRERYVLLSKDVWDEIDFSKTINPKERNDTRVFFFISKGKQNDRIMITNNIRRWTRRITGKAYSIHKFRHFCATLLLENGKDITAVSRYLGHSSITITARFYAHTRIKLEDIKQTFKEI